MVLTICQLLPSPQRRPNGEEQVNNKIYRTKDAVQRVRDEKENVDKYLIGERWQKTTEADFVRLKKRSGERYWEYYNDSRPYVAEVLVEREPEYVYRCGYRRHWRELWITSSLSKLADKLRKIAVGKNVRLVSVHRATAAEALVLKAFDTERTVEFVDTALNADK